MRTGGRQPKPPRSQVPQNGGDQQCKDHGKAGSGADLKNQIHRQKRENSEGHRPRRSEHSSQIEEARQDHRNVGFQRVGINDRGHGVGCIVEAVDELEAKRNQQWPGPAAYMARCWLQ